MSSATASPADVAAAVEEYRWEAPADVRPFLDGPALADICIVVAQSFAALASRLGTTVDSASRLARVGLPSGSEPGYPIVLPLNLSGYGMLAAVDPGPPLRCRSIEVIGPGRFVHGDDNSVFGRWNTLVSVSRTGLPLQVVSGHGGELIPGRLDDHVAALRDYVRTGVRRPVQLDIDPSMACPSACTFCFSASYRASRRTGLLMHGALLLELIDGWADQGVRVVRFDGGGDPLTHPRLADAIGAAARRGLRTAVLTAGDLLREAHLKPFLDARTYLRVSLNAGTDATRLEIHRPRARRLGLHGPLAMVRRLADLRAAEYGTMGRALMPLGATSMLAPANACDTYAIAEEARRAGFDHLSFRVVLGAEHAVSYPPAARDELNRQLAQVLTELVDDEFQVFTPTRPLTDTGYRPAEHFDTCLASTHRALVEVGPDPHTAVNVPCGRYRGHGFRWRPGCTELTVFGLLRSAADINYVLQGPTMARLVSAFPDSCGDCIDRSANIMFNGIASALRSDPDALFFRFQALPEEGASQEPQPPAPTFAER